MKQTSYTLQRTALALSVSAALGIISETVIAQENSSNGKTEEATLSTLKVSANAEKSTSIMSLDTPSSTSKFGTSVKETPASISIIDQEFIRETGAKTVDEALLYTPGVHSGNSGFSTRADWVTVRGVDDLVTYRDGLRSYGSGNAPRLNVYSLDRIEVLKGPSAAMYGQGGLGGILNTTTKLPQADSQNEVWLQVGNYNRKQAAFDSTGTLTDDGKLLYRIVGLQRDSDTQVDYVNDDSYFLAPSLTWKPTDKTSITLHLHHQEDDSIMAEQFLPQSGTLDVSSRGKISTNTFVGEPDWDRDDKKITETSLFIDHELTDIWQLSASARQSESSTTFRSHRTPFFSSNNQPDADGNITRIIRTLDTNSKITNLDVHLTGTFALGATQHNARVGADYFESLSESDNFYLGIGKGGNFNLYEPSYGNIQSGVVSPSDLNDSEIKQTGLYVSDHITLNNWALSVALRHDDYQNTQLNVSGPDESSKETETTKQTGLMYNFDNGISPYVSYAESFTPNTGTDGTAASNILKPTKGEQKELGIKYLSPKKDVELTLAYFDIEQENRISDGLTSGGITQIGAVVKGWEAEVKKAWQDFTLQAGYTDLDAQDKDADTRIPHMPERLASLWGQYQLSTSVRIGAGARYKGDIVGKGDGPLLPSVTLFDATIGYSFENWDFSLDAKNLADKTYIARCRSENAECYYGDRRTVTANARYYF
jgi:iron complex outermembrane recepter protein